MLPISAATRDNYALLVRRLRKLLASPQLQGPPPQPTEPVLQLDGDDEATECHVIIEGEGAWRLTGTRIEKAAAMTNWDYAEAQDRFQRIMGALGASEQLKAAGAKNGDLIMVRSGLFVL